MSRLSRIIISAPDNTNDALLANGLSSAPQNSKPTVGTGHTLSAQDLKSEPENSTPTVVDSTPGTNDLLADNLQTSSYTSKSYLTDWLLKTGNWDDTGYWSDVAYWLEIDQPTANNLQSASQISMPAVADIATGAIDFLAKHLRCASQIKTPVLRQTHVLSVTSIEAAPQNSKPTADSTAHILLATSIQSGSYVSKPTLRGWRDVDCGHSTGWGGVSCE